jgi:hypothetical protein
MASSQPFEQLTGTLQVYVAPVGEAEPAVNATPAGNWYLLGPTDGEQSVQHAGALTYFTDNDHQSKVKAVRPEEDEIIAFTLVGMALEDYARVLDDAANLVSAGGPPATRTMPLKRGAVPNEFAMLLKGAAASPYGAFPGQYMIPRGVFDGEPQPTWAKDGRPALECEFHAIEDDNQSDINRLGWLKVQTS